VQIGPNGTPVVAPSGQPAQPVIGPSGTPVLAQPGQPGAAQPNIGPNGRPVLAQPGQPGSAPPSTAPNGTPSSAPAGGRPVGWRFALGKRAGKVIARGTSLVSGVNVGSRKAIGGGG